jgi:replicative DNA helicase
MYDVGVRVFFLDYIQLVRWGFKTESETLRLKEVTNKLHRLALQYDVPIVILSQLTKESANRATKKDQDPTPTISDIRDGGYIINDSDVILLLYRPNMIKTTNKKMELLSDVTEDAQIIIGKGRSGPVGTIYTTFRNYCMSFCRETKNDDLLF